MAKSQSKPEGAERARFEDVLAELESIVHALEEGELGLDEALTRYERGVKLLRECHGLLQQVERRIEQLSGVDREGRPVVTPLDDTALSLEEKARQRSRRRTAPPPGATSSLFPTEPFAEDDAPSEEDG